MRFSPYIFMLVAVLIVLVEPVLGVVRDSGGGDTELAIDHVILAVNDIDEAKRTFSTFGFQQKEGRLHKNGVFNQHMKFKNGTELELITLVRKPGDIQAKEYASFLKVGDGGAFCALRGDLKSVQFQAQKLGIEALAVNSGIFHYVVFSSQGFENIFFIKYDNPMQEPDETLLLHPNGAAGIEEVVMEASPLLGKLLLSLGAKKCGFSEMNDGRKGTRYELANGKLTVIPHSVQTRPRVKEIQIQSRKSSQSSKVRLIEKYGVRIRF